MRWLKRQKLLAVSISGALIGMGIVVGYAGQRYRAQQTEAQRERVEKHRALNKMRADLKDIKLLSEAIEPRLKGEKNQLRVAQLLRNMIYSHVAWADEPGVRVAPYDWKDMADTYRKSVLDPTYGHMCGGRVIVYLMALRSFGITARKVGLYPKVKGLSKVANSHASVGVLIDGKWIVEDPTFNISLTDENGRRIGWIEARQQFDAGKTVNAQSDGFPVDEHYSLRSYTSNTGLTFDDFTNFVNTSPYWDGKEHDAGKLPESWDGVLYYKSGKTFPALKSDASGIYDLLAGPLT